jgi:Arc/MetJ-type ribon-helix-helix transcriptional regulator
MKRILLEENTAYLSGQIEYLMSIGKWRAKSEMLRAAVEELYQKTKKNDANNH